MSSFYVALHELSNNEKKDALKIIFENKYIFIRNIKIKHLNCTRRK